MISTHYVSNGTSYQLTLEPITHSTGERELVFTRTPLDGDGDFQSDACVSLLQTADIVVTNPPFSLFRAFIAQLMTYNTKFLIIGSMNGIAYKDVFPFILSKQLWLGVHNGKMEFQVPSHYQYQRRDETGATFKALGNICWFTNLHHCKLNDTLKLVKTYNPVDYPMYDNYDAINVNAVTKTL